MAQPHTSYRLDDETRRLLRALAARRGLSVSAYLRLAAREAAARERVKRTEGGRQ